MSPEELLIYHPPTDEQKFCARLTEAYDEMSRAMVEAATSRLRHWKGSMSLPYEYEYVQVPIDLRDEPYRIATRSLIVDLALRGLVWR